MVRLSILRRYLAAGLFLVLSGGLLGEPASALQQLPAPSDTLALTLAGAQRMALRLSPSYSAASRAAAVARGEVQDARRLPNPELELEAPRASAHSLGPYQAILGQTVEWAGQRGLRIGAAEHGAARARAEVTNAAREMLRDVSLAYVEAVAASRRLELADRVLELNRRLSGAVHTQLEAGKISTLDANLAEIELGRARAHVLAARRERTGATMALRQQIGLPPDRPLRLALPEDSIDATVPPEDSLVALALTRRPDLSAVAAAVDQATGELRLARREAIPALTIGPMAERDEATGSPRLGFAAGISVPLWNWNTGVVTRRRAELERARYDRTATELAVQAEVREARSALDSATEEVRELTQSVLEPARENQRLLEIAYQAGKIDLPSLLLVRNQLLDAETDYWDAWLAREQAWLRLQAATSAWDVDGAAVEGREP